jgi:hypothetical protein
MSTSKVEGRLESAPEVQLSSDAPIIAASTLRLAPSVSKREGVLGAIERLIERHPGAPISYDAIAREAGQHRRSVRRAVKFYEASGALFRFRCTAPGRGLVGCTYVMRTRDAQSDCEPVIDVRTRDAQSDCGACAPGLYTHIENRELQALTNTARSYDARSTCDFPPSEVERREVESEESSVETPTEDRTHLASTSRTSIEQLARIDPALAAAMAAI